MREAPFEPVPYYLLTKAQAAGMMSLTVKGLDARRARDPEFPAPVRGLNEQMLLFRSDEVLAYMRERGFPEDILPQIPCRDGAAKTPRFIPCPDPAR